MFRLFLLVSLFSLVLFQALSVNLAKAANVIEVYLLAGQSNMSGVGSLSNLPAGYLPQPNVMLYHADSTAGNNPDTWIPNAPSGITGFGRDTFGPEVSLGKRLSELRPGVDIALIKTARGGLNLAVDLNPGTAGDPSSQGLRYKTLLTHIGNGLADLQSENPGKQIQLKAMFWHQGEGDANTNFANDFEQNFVNFIGRLREDLAAPDLPFIYGTIAQRSSTNVNTVIDAQFRVDESSGAASATPGASVLDFRNFPTHADLIDGFRDADDTHFNAEAQIQMGRMYAEKYAAIAIPEPSTSILLLSGMLALLCRRKAVA